MKLNVSLKYYTIFYHVVLSYVDRKMLSMHFNIICKHLFCHKIIEWSSFVYSVNFRYNNENLKQNVYYRYFYIRHSCTCLPKLSSIYVFLKV
jgi:hypothetical protein